MQMVVLDRVHPLLRLLLHLLDCAGTVTVRGGAGSKRLFGAGHRTMGNGCGVPSREGHSYSVIARDAIIRVSLHSIHPFKGQSRVETFLRLKCAACCDEDVPPAIGAALDGCVCILGRLILVKVDVKEICVIDV